MSINVLLVDDDESMLMSIERSLRRAGWKISTESDPVKALRRLDGLDLLITDVRMPGLNGIDLMRKARARCPGLEVIIITAFASVSDAISAVQEGVRGYIEKPFDPRVLIQHFEKISEIKQLRRIASLSGRGDLVGASSQMQQVYNEIDVASHSDSPLLVTGETGTGKDLTARAVHEHSLRNSGPYIAVDLGAIPGELAEAELFGHEKGAFTGAHAAKKGRFALADGGTLFLDEVTSLPVDLQSKLLRALDSKEIWPVGGEKPVHADVRIVAASNADIEDLVKKADFREDLYYRLNVLRIHLPPLRGRPEDIPSITRVLLDRMTAEGEYIVEISAEAVSYLINHEWPGNVRELSNVLERAVARAKPSVQTGRVILGIESLTHEAAPDFHGLTFREARNKAADRWAAQAIKSALAAEEGNVTRTAKRLKMNRTALIRSMKTLNISK